MSTSLFSLIAIPIAALLIIQGVDIFADFITGLFHDGGEEGPSLVD